MLGFTDTWRGQPVSVQGSGMVRAHVGLPFSGDTFYKPRPELM